MPLAREQHPAQRAALPHSLPEPLAFHGLIRDPLSGDTPGGLAPDRRLLPQLGQPVRLRLQFPEERLERISAEEQEHRFPLPSHAPPSPDCRRPHRARLSLRRLAAWGVPVAPAPTVWSLALSIIGIRSSTGTPFYRKSVYKETGAAISLLMGSLFPNLPLRLRPVLRCSTVLTAALLVQFIGPLGDLRGRVDRFLGRDARNAPF